MYRRPARVTVLAITLCIVYGCAVVIYAQPMCCQVISSKVAEIEHKLDRIDDQHMAERLARVETALESNNKLLMGAILPLLFLVVERIVTHGKTRRRVERPNE